MVTMGRGQLIRRWEAGKRLRSGSFAVLREQPDLLWFPLLHALCVGLTVVVLFFLIFFSALTALFIRGTGVSHMPGALALLILWVWYFCIFFLAVFFQSCVMYVVSKRLSGGQPSVGDGFAAAFGRLFPLFLWSLIEASVGTVFYTLSRVHRGIEQLLGFLLGGLWGLSTYFVLPAIILDRRSPLEAMRHSVCIFKETWGETAFSIIGIFMPAYLFAMLLLVAMAIAEYYTAAYLGFTYSALIGVCFVLFFILYFAVLAVLSTIVKAVLYEYGRSGNTITGFSTELLISAVRTR